MKTSFEELKQTIATLRGPDGCPWDKKQTHESLIKCLQNERAGREIVSNFAK